MKTRTSLFILFIVVLLGSVAYTAIQRPQEFFRRETWAIPVATGVAMLLTSLFDDMRQRGARDRQMKGMTKLFEIIETFGDFTYYCPPNTTHGVSKARGVYQVRWVSQKLNMMVGFWIDGAYAWCQYQEPGDEHLWRSQGTPSEIADLIRTRIAKLVSA
jgi:UDP-N-acetylmuramyl pentapeptide phosphotransferase/UDP-N-acetylglucosamine-1-phosphate transferase